MDSQMNQLAELLAKNDVAIGASCSLYSPTVIEEYGELGLDWIWLDFEHNGPTPWDSLALEKYTRAAEIADIEIVARLPSGTSEMHPPLIRKVMDAGIRNIIIPRVETAEEVRSAVKATQFEYADSLGERGFGIGRGTSWGKDISASWVESVDESVLCGIMVENVTAIDNLTNILSVPDLGFVFIGSMDISASIGQPTKTDVQKFEDKIDTIAHACVEAGVPYGQAGAGYEQAVSIIDRGAQLVNIGSDLDSIRTVLSSRLNEIRSRSSVD